MAKTISLSLRKDLIMEAVKADTFQRAQADKSADPVKFAALAFNEAAGDETYHDRKLLRLCRSALAKFATMMAEFVDSENGSIQYTLTDASDAISLTIVVNDRYNSGLAQPLASLVEDYIVYSMDGVWWQSFDASLAKDYYALADDTLSFIRRCLAKTAPDAASATYDQVTGTVSGAGIASISFPQAVYGATIGEVFESPVAVTSPSGLALTYESSNPAVATVNNSGVVTLVATGSTIIKAKFAGNSSYQATSGQYTLNVTATPAI